MGKPSASRKRFAVRYTLVEPARLRAFGDRVEVSGKSTNAVVMRSRSGRFTTAVSAKAVDRTVVRYSDALKRLAKR